MRLPVGPDHGSRPEWESMVDLLWHGPGKCKGWWIGSIRGGLSTVGDGSAVHITGGSSIGHGSGGSLKLLSGFSDSLNSEDVSLASADGASMDGKSASGSLFTSTGDSYDASSARRMRMVGTIRPRMAFVMVPMSYKPTQS